jgi:polyhydroxybutyrate depolymerase
MLSRRSDRTGTTGRSHRLRRTAAPAAVLVTLLAAACAPPVVPDPLERPREPGRGIVADVDVAPSEGCANPTLPTGKSHLIIPTVDGNRYTRLDIPAAANSGTPSPVVLSLHPFTIGPDGWDGYSGMAKAGTDRGYIVVTPLGSDPGPRWAVPGGLATGIDDIAYLMTLLNRIEDSTCVDRNREFAAGFSAGAAMAQALSCAVPWRMAAVAGSGGTNLTSTCPASNSTDVMVIHGSADSIAPTSGSQIAFAPPSGISVNTVVGVNAARAGCSGSPQVEQLTASVIVDRYVGCNDRVEYWRLIGAGHTWAGADPVIDFITGATNTDISATERVLDFFDAD